MTVPGGKQRPRLNKYSDISPPTDPALYSHLPPDAFLYTSGVNNSRSLETLPGSILSILVLSQNQF